jgi:AIPR protein
MNMDNLEEFRAELLARVRVRASATENFTVSAFAEECGQLLEEAEEISDFSLCYYHERGARNRNLAVDGYAFDDADRSVRLVLASFSGESAAASISRSDVRPLFNALVAFIEDSVKGLVERQSEESSPGYGLAKELRTRAEGVTRYRCFLVTDDVLSERVKDWPEGEVDGVPVEFHIWDVSRFHRAHLSRSGRDELIVDFSEFVEGGLPCLPANVVAGDYEGYLCVVPGAALADIYDRYGSRLLEGNVRSFLSTTVSVNKGIQVTLAKEPQRFFAYNNGIAATASRIEFAQGPNGCRITAAEDFQIVNGGQTTASLAYARRKSGSSLSEVSVQMKLSVLDADNAGNVVPLISRYSNSQNKVSDADFFSNHEYHRLMEKLSRRLRAPAHGGSQIQTFWFYERARGQYVVELSRLSPSERKRFEMEVPREQIITKTDLAKVENSWRLLPHDVSRGAQKNFVRFAEFVTKAWDNDPTHFHDEYFREEVAKVIIFRALEKLVPKEPWYGGGYRAQIVTYSIAKLVALAEGEGTTRTGRKVNLEQVWKRQGPTPVMLEQLRLIAKAAYEVLVNPEAGIQNVTEWAKKELAWRRLSERKVRLLPEFAEECRDVEEAAGRQRAARANARVDVAVDVLRQVLEFGAVRWASLRSLASEANALTPDDDQLLRVACNPTWMPSDRQAKALVKLKARLDADGIGVAPAS